MEKITLNISINGDKRERIYDNNKLIYDICQELCPPNTTPNEYGLLVNNSDSRSAYWLDNNQKIEFYNLRNNTELEFSSKFRFLKIQTMDETRKVVQIDDSKTVAQIMPIICSKMGIANHEEYGLMQQLNDEERMQTLTLQRKTKNSGQLPRDFEKLEKMKQKLQTDDDALWLTPGKTLREQGICDEILLLKRRYFYSDKNVDARDPVQLNLLYVQLRSAILCGKHPITQDEAVRLAGIQCVIDNGHSSPNKLKTLHLDLKEYLPKEYVKVKGIEKKVMGEYTRLGEMSEIEAKVRYTQLCRSLKTYGITFFLVKEKMKSKNKLVPRLFGVNKESVMRVDEKTKDILETWPLTTIKRYSSQARLFTLDFGDYADSMYSMQTTDGEAIAQLLSGYIDIIMSKRKNLDNVDDEDDENSFMHEESVEPTRANFIMHNTLSPRGIEESNVALTGVMRVPNHVMLSTAGGMKKPSSVAVIGNQMTPQPGTIAYGDSSQQQPNSMMMMRGAGGRIARGAVAGNVEPRGFQVHDLEQPKRALISRIDENIRLVNNLRECAGGCAIDYDYDTAEPRSFAQKNMEERVILAQNDIITNITAMGLAAGDIVSIMSPDSTDDDNCMDYDIVNRAAATIGVHLKQLVDSVRLARTLPVNEDGSLSPSSVWNPQALLDCTKLLADSLHDFMIAAAPPTIKSSTSDDTRASQQSNTNSTILWKKNLMDAAGRLGDASHQLLKVANGSKPKDYLCGQTLRMRDLILEKGKAVGAATYQLVDCTKTLSRNLLQQTNSTATGNQDPHHIAGDLVAAAKIVGISTSQLVAYAKVAAFNLEQSKAQQQLLKAAKLVDRSAESVLLAGKPLHLDGRQALLTPLQAAVKGVNLAVADLVSCVSRDNYQTPLGVVANDYANAKDKLNDGDVNLPTLKRQALELAHAGNQLKKNLESRANDVENPQLTNADRDNLMFAAQRLTESIASLANTIKSSSSMDGGGGGGGSRINEEDESLAILSASRSLNESVQSSGVVHSLLCEGLTHNLQLTGRITANNAAQLVLLAQEASQCAARISNYQITCEAQELTDVVLPSVVEACSLARIDPTNVRNQIRLFASCKELCENLKRFLPTCESFCHMVSDGGMQSALQQSIQQTSGSLVELQHCVQSAEGILNSAHSSTINNSTNQSSGLANGLLTIWDNEIQPIVLVDNLINQIKSTGAVNNLLTSTTTLTENDLRQSCRDILAGLHFIDTILRDFIQDIHHSPDSAQSALPQIALWLKQGHPRFIQAMQNLAQFVFQRDQPNLGSGLNVLEHASDYHQAIDKCLHLLQAYESIVDDAQKRHEFHQLLLTQAFDDCFTAAEICCEDIPSRRSLNDLLDIVLGHKFQITSTNSIAGGGANGVGGAGAGGISNNGTIANNQLPDEVDNNGVYISMSPTNANLIGQVQKLASAFDNLLAGLISTSSTGSFPSDNAIQPLANTYQQLFTHCHELARTRGGVGGGGGAGGAGGGDAHSWLDNLGQITDATEALVRSLAINSNNNDENARQKSLLEAAGDLSQSLHILLQLCEGDSRVAMARKADVYAKEAASVAQSHQIPTQPLTQATYQQNVQRLAMVSERAKSTLRELCSPNVSDRAQILATAHSNMVEVFTCASQSRYLLALGHPDSEPGLIQMHRSLQKVMTDLDDVDKLCARVQQITKVSEMKEGLPQLLQQGNKAALAAKDLVSLNYGPIAFRKKLINFITAFASQVAHLTPLCHQLSNLPNDLLILPTDQLNTIHQDVASLLNHSRKLLSATLNDPEAPAFKNNCHLTDAMVESQGEISEVSDQLYENYRECLENMKNENDHHHHPTKQLQSVNACCDAIQKLNLVVQQNRPGRRECLHGLGQVQRWMEEVQESAMHPVSVSHNQEQSLNMLTSGLRQLHSFMPIICDKVALRVEELPQTITQTTDCLASVVQHSLACVNAQSRVQDRNNLCEQIRTVLESFTDLLENVNNDNGDGKKESPSEIIRESCNDVQQACSDLLTTCETLATRLGAVATLVNSINSVYAKLPEASQSATTNVSSDQYNYALQLLRSIASKAQQLANVDKDATNEDNSSSSSSSSPVSGSFARDLMALPQTLAAIIAQSSTSQPALRDRLLKVAAQLSQASIVLLQSSQPDSCRQVKELCTDLSSTLQASMQSRVAAPQACREALAAMSDIQSDLDTAVLFATSGAFLGGGASLLSTTTNAADMSAIGHADQCVYVSNESRQLLLNVNNLQESLESSPPNQELLQGSISGALTHLRSLVQIVKASAASQTSKYDDNSRDSGSVDAQASQIALLHAIRDVANSLTDLLQSAKDYGTPHNNKETMSNCANSLHVNVNNLVGSFQSASDLQQRGIRALDVSVGAMQRQVETMQHWTPLNDANLYASTSLSSPHDGSETGGLKDSTGGGASLDGVTLRQNNGGLRETSGSYRPEDLVRHTQLVMQAVSRAMTAMKTNKQEDLLQAANAGRKAVSDLSRQLRGTLTLFLREKHEADKEANSASNTSLTEVVEQWSDRWSPTLETGRNVLESLLQLYTQLSQSVREGKESNARMKMNLTSRRIAEAIHEMTEAATKLKGSDLVDPNDPTTIAEEELMGAAGQIEAAARKLAQLRPRRTAETTDSETEKSTEEMSFDEAILASAKSIVTATSALVQAATRAQHELVEQGKLKPVKALANEAEESQWSQGLISAARMVAAATQNLCDAANRLMQEDSGGSMEQVISASKQVAAGTAQLLVACMVKADANSKAAQRLQEAGRAVRRATDMLVKEAREALNQQSTTSKISSSSSATSSATINTEMNSSMVSSMKKLIDTEADIIAKERELTNLRMRLQAMKKDHMKTKPEYFSS